MTLRRHVIDARKARGGEIVLRRGRERGVFIAGLVGAVVPVAMTYWR